MNYFKFSAKTKPRVIARKAIKLPQLSSGRRSGSIERLHFIIWVPFFLLRQGFGGQVNGVTNEINGITKTKNLVPLCLGGFKRFKTALTNELIKLFNKIKHDAFGKQKIHQRTDGLFKNYTNEIGKHYLLENKLLEYLKKLNIFPSYFVEA